MPGVIIFFYDMQKLIGWFNNFGKAVGIKASIEQLKKRKFPG
jgi:hypothetical protein